MLQLKGRLELMTPWFIKRTLDPFPTSYPEMGILC